MSSLGQMKKNKTIWFSKCAHTLTLIHTILYRSILIINHIFNRFVMFLSLTAAGAYILSNTKMSLSSYLPESLTQLTCFSFSGESNKKCPAAGRTTPLSALLW